MKFKKLEKEKIGKKREIGKFREKDRICEI